MAVPQILKLSGILLQVEELAEPMTVVDHELVMLVPVVASDAGVCARQKTRPTGGADRALVVGSVKGDALMNQTVDHRRRKKKIA